MTKEKQPIINNSSLRDGSSKLIFGDNILCSQFLRDYGDMEILKDIRPEDIEDVSERYVPLYSSERESDTVKKVDISRYLELKKDEKTLHMPLYIVSLIEHKTKVEYNVAMQILRYMIHIWEDYEKEMNGKNPGSSSRKDFRYPPILPIVYYEGKRKWTASSDLADRILCGELLNKYLPHFRYQLVKLHDYSNEELLAKGNEISLAMLINKIQCVEDISAFKGLPEGQVNKILKDTPDYLLEIMAKVLRALLYSMDVSEEETESTVSKIKERRMGRLFEQVPNNIRAEKRKWQKEKEAACAERDAICAERDAICAERDAICAERDEICAERDAICAERDAICAERDEICVERDEARKEIEILKYMVAMSRDGLSDAEIKASLVTKFALTKEQAEEEFRKALGEKKAED